MISFRIPDKTIDIRVIAMNSLQNHCLPTFFGGGGGVNILLLLLLLLLLFMNTDSQDEIFPLLITPKYRSSVIVHNRFVFPEYVQPVLKCVLGIGVYYLTR